MRKKIWIPEELRLLHRAYEQSLGIRNKPLPLPQELLAKFTKRACIKKACKLGLFKAIFTRPTIRICHPTDLAYIAGLFDGEGSISLNKKFNIVTFRIANSDLSVLQWLQSTIGTGKIRRKSDLVYYTKPHFEYVFARSIDVYAFLKSLLPFLKIKQEKARNAIAIIDAKFPFFQNLNTF